jgi:hypothetical protein
MEIGKAFCLRDHQPAYEFRKRFIDERRERRGVRIPSGVRAEVNKTPPAEKNQDREETCEIERRLEDASERVGSIGIVDAREGYLHCIVLQRNAEPLPACMTMVRTSQSYETLSDVHIISSTRNLLAGTDWRGKSG